MECIFTPSRESRSSCSSERTEVKQQENLVRYCAAVSLYCFSCSYTKTKNTCTVYRYLVTFSVMIWVLCEDPLCRRDDAPAQTQEVVKAIKMCLHFFPITTRPAYRVRTITNTVTWIMKPVVRWFISPTNENLVLFPFHVHLEKNANN
jgi:hypothetical protein